MSLNNNLNSVLVIIHTTFQFSQEHRSMYSRFCLCITVTVACDNDSHMAHEVFSLTYYFEGLV